MKIKCFLGRHDFPNFSIDKILYTADGNVFATISKRTCRACPKTEYLVLTRNDASISEKESAEYWRVTSDPQMIRSAMERFIGNSIDGSMAVRLMLDSLSDAIVSTEIKKRQQGEIFPDFGKTIEQIRKVKLPSEVDYIPECLKDQA